MVNNVIGVVNYVIAARPPLLNFMIADSQAGRLAGEVADRFEGRPLTDAEAVVLLAYS
jgi:hypothetical protein